MNDLTPSSAKHCGYLVFTLGPCHKEKSDKETPGMSPDTLSLAAATYFTFHLMNQQQDDIICRDEFVISMNDAGGRQLLNILPSLPIVC